MEFEGSCGKATSVRLRRYIVSAGGLGNWDRALSFAVLEEFYLAQALFGFGFGFVGTAEVLALLGENFVAFFHFFDHFRTSDSILISRAVGAMHGLL